MYVVEMPTFSFDAENFCSENTRNSSCQVTVFDVVVVGSDKQTNVQTYKRTNTQAALKYIRKNAQTYRHTNIRIYVLRYLCTGFVRAEFTGSEGVS